MTVEGDSNKSSGEACQTWGSISRGRGLREEAADAGEKAADEEASSWAGDVECTEPEALLGVSAGPSFEDEYRHSRSDLVHVAHRGLSSSHFTLLRLQVRLDTSAGVCKERAPSSSRPRDASR